MILLVKPQVVMLDLGVIPSPSGSGELLLADDRSCRLVFVPTVEAGAPRVAMATFAGFSQVIFGYPNDEALSGHPLQGPTDTWDYGFYEVQGSPWPRRLEAQNRVNFPDRTSSWRQRHFLLVCHEDLVEVLADDVTVELFDQPFEEVALHALRLNLLGSF
ncbi:hypothetical protein [Micromonospora sp. WMMD812]|uniref:hypothetical protein n=1 Tax=Micromonospora sp. WMMD812 TaxID=3015152 RepID=UPI00248AF5C6|nr:hypothetical protein [Micromonospora sp. WMMD812]WBB69086.1 hypothetical protein O7603_06975 [Micromonospora sp. WMMD812]